MTAGERSWERGWEGRLNRSTFPSQSDTAGDVHDVPLLTYAFVRLARRGAC